MFQSFLDGSQFDIKILGGKKQSDKNSSFILLQNQILCTKSVLTFVSREGRFFLRGDLSWYCPQPTNSWPGQADMGLKAKSANVAFLCLFDTCRVIWLGGKYKHSLTNSVLNTHFKCRNDASSELKF